MSVHLIRKLLSFGAAIVGGLAVGKSFDIYDPAEASWVVASGRFVILSHESQPS